MGIWQRSALSIYASRAIAPASGGIALIARGVAAFIMGVCSA